MDTHRHHHGTLTAVNRGRWDDIVVLVFALLGFVGAVFLYATGSPPIIVSVFLATGVAALVYRYLGGIQGAKFAWGALKLTGTAAALVGVAFGINHYLEYQSLVMVPPDGMYEWQWAGSGWKGYVDVQKNGVARIEMLRYATCGAEQKMLQVMEQDGAAKVDAIENLTKLHVKIPVRFVKYDANCNRTGIAEPTILEGILGRTPSFAGQIQYRSKYGAPLGDMILVKGYSSGRR